MKKFIALILALAMATTLAACAPANEPDETTAETTAEETTVDTTAEETTAGDTSAAVSGTAGEIMRAAFVSIMNEDAAAEPLAVAEALAGNENIAFMAGATEVVPGWLNGFDAEEITGFEKGAMFGPMIGSIPFIGYVFQLEEGADVDAFINTLEESANLRWNICVEAEELVTEKVGNTVFFLMCPSSFEG